MKESYEPNVEETQLFTPVGRQEEEFLMELREESVSMEAAEEPSPAPEEVLPDRFPEDMQYEQEPVMEEPISPERPSAGPTVVPQPKRKRVTGWTVMWKASKFIWRMALGLVLAGVILVGGLFGYLTVTEYNPAYAETADRGSINRTETIKDRSLRIITFNTGYGGLGEDADFFMDGGEGINPQSEELILDNMSGIERILSASDADFILLQEVDTDSARSFEINQWLRYEHDLEDYESRFALNYSCRYVPYPVTEHMGKIHSGVATYSKYDIVSATRFSLPNPFTWPTRVANLKRCLLVTRIPIEDSEKQLVLINLHLDAYDDGEGRIEQTKQLIALVKEEYAKGNYVIAGGDFNQTFPDCKRYPLLDESYWAPGTLQRVYGGLRYAYDDSDPTCRLLNRPYDRSAQDTQFYVIDGFLVTDNITVETVDTVDGDFKYSDHNAVVMDFILEEEK